MGVAIILAIISIIYLLGGLKFLNEGRKLQSNDSTRGHVLSKKKLLLGKGLLFSLILIATGFLMDNLKLLRVGLFIPMIVSILFVKTNLAWEKYAKILIFLTFLILFAYMNFLTGYKF